MSQVLGIWGPATVFQLRVILSSSTAGHFLGCMSALEGHGSVG